VGEVWYFLHQINEQFAQKNIFTSKVGTFLQVSLFTDPEMWNLGLNNINAFRFYGQLFLPMVYINMG